MCRITDADVKTCLLCGPLRFQKCTHEIAVCSNPAVHPGWKVVYSKNSGGISTFQGCGFCKYADKAALQAPAANLHDNPGWPGCCYPPPARSYHWIPPEDWQLVATYHQMDIPPTVKSALDNLNAQRSKQQSKKAAAASQHLTIHPPSRMPVPIPKSNGNGARSYSPSAIHISPHEGTSPRSSTSSGGSNSSGSPPSSTAGSRRGGSFESDGLSSSPTILVRSGSSGSQDDPRMMIRSSSRQSARKDGSPMGRIARGEVAINGKRRSNSDPKHQPQTAPPPPPSAYVQRGRDSPTHAREKGRESPTQTRFRSSSSVSSNHPYSNPNSAASSSMKKLSLEQPSVPAPAPPPLPVYTTPASVVGSASSRTPIPPAVPRSRNSNAAPSINSVMADMSNMSLNNNNHTTLARLQQMENAGKRGVIPPHVKRAGSVISASSGSSSSTNSSAREGTVISDGAFTDYLSDDSDLEMQRLAEIEAEMAYQEALRKHEEMEFREARESLTRGGGQGFADPYRRAPPMMSGSRIRV